MCTREMTETERRMPSPSNHHERKAHADHHQPFHISSSCTPVSLQFLDVYYSIKLDNNNGSRTGASLRRFLCLDTATMSTTEERTILRGVTGVVSPGEMLAVIGPSGSGKSTLLTILAGRHHGKYTGTVLANGERLTRPMMKRTGFVTQDDLLYPHLTVKETLVFCSLLRLPKTLTRDEKVRVAESVISELGLGKCENTIIGNSFVRGVSGGERKRVSIGHEMLLNPSLLLLDEPTSGLDSTAAYRLVSTLAGLASKGKAVVASVHQPSSRVFQMFDSVLLLSEGRPLYFGKGSEAMDYFDSVGFSPRFPVNPADFMLDLANGIAEVEGHQGDMEKSNVKQSLSFSYKKLLAPKLKNKVCMDNKIPTQTTPQTAGGDEEQRRSNHSNITWFNQLATLLHRSLKERKHEAFATLRVFQVVAGAVLAGAMWWHSSIYDVQDRLGLLFFISIFWGVITSFNAVFTFPQEKAILIKETFSGMYTLSSYFMARMAGDLPMELLLPTVFTTILYWMAGLRPEPGAFALTLVVLLGYVLVAQGLGLALGAAIMNAKQASTVVTLTTLAFVLTGGFYVHKVPSCLEWVKYTSFTFHGYRLLIRVQYSGREMGSIFGGVGDDDLHEKHGGVAVNAMALVAMLVGYRFLAYIALRRSIKV